MKRWNGWGNVNTTYPVPAPAQDYLAGLFGALTPEPDADYERVLGSVPAARLKEHALINLSAEARLKVARGQSLQDWVEMRSGKIPAFPDGVATPTNSEQVRELMDHARTNGVKVIPYGGGTSVVGHINALPSQAPVLTLSLEKMNRLLEIDEIGQTAVFEAGVTGPELEAALAEHGYTLGHYPQSHEYSTLGGWIATRSSGQQSFQYGRIEQLFAGGSMETPRGRMDLPHFPASAAGPDLKEVVLGSEGRMGVITEARVRISRKPESEEFHGIFFQHWEQGVEVVRRIAQERIPVSMMRFSNAQETETTLILSGKKWVGQAERGLTLIGYGKSRCILVFGVTGTREHVARTRRIVAGIARKNGGLFVGRVAGHSWEKARFYAPYLRNTLWDLGVTVDTLETALPWAQVQEAAVAIPKSILQAMEARGEKVHVFAHLSHIYRDGASLYTTYLFRRPRDPEALMENWRAMKHSASLTIQRLGGTISHQHGVGMDHAAYLPMEKGKLGMEAIRAVCQALDPDGMMNPGKLFKSE